LAGDVNLGCVGVETVFEKFFHDAYRTLNYLTCRNAVDDIFGEGADFWSSAAVAAAGVATVSTISCC
jgi:hypothetical protein